MRSDKFTAWCFLKDLCRDYASDLVRDSTQALRKLEDFSHNGKMYNTMRSFNVDVVSLYDSLSPKLVLEAFVHAVKLLRHDWDRDLVEWLKNLISLSFEASFVNFRGVVLSRTERYSDRRDIKR